MQYQGNTFEVIDAWSVLSVVAMLIALTNGSSCNVDGKYDTILCSDKTGLETSIMLGQTKIGRENRFDDDED